ncbi:MAG: hypothetical protein J3Q66DRAFT_322831 [Benniella sp.]|nr:MAG: hypothetical protein J3Q66DRAFT_322831 [Benniella sp.]
MERTWTIGQGEETPFAFVYLQGSRITLATAIVGGEREEGRKEMLRDIGIGQGPCEWCYQQSGLFASPTTWLLFFSRMLKGREMYPHHAFSLFFFFFFYDALVAMEAGYGKRWLLSCWYPGHLLCSIASFSPRLYQGKGHQGESSEGGQSLTGPDRDPKQASIVQPSRGKGWEAESISWRWRRRARERPHGDKDGRGARPPPSQSICFAYEITACLFFRVPIYNTYLHTEPIISAPWAKKLDHMGGIPVAPSIGGRELGGRLGFAFLYICSEKGRGERNTRLPPCAERPRG